MGATKRPAAPIAWNTQVQFTIVRPSVKRSVLKLALRRILLRAARSSASQTLQARATRAVGLYRTSSRKIKGLAVSAAAASLSLKMEKPEQLDPIEQAVEEEQERIIREVDSVPHSSSWWSWFSWKPTSDVKLKEAEKAMLQVVSTPYEQFLVKIDENTAINTIKLGQGPPLVLIHGFAGGIGIWISNLDYLAQHYTVYAIDLVGFGRSSRTPFEGKSSAVAEKWFLDSFHKWTDIMKLDKFELLGHSMGGYLSAVYALQRPEKLSHVILADPWGVPGKPPGWESRIPLHWKIIAKAVLSISSSPMSLLRAAGPVGPTLFQKLRPDLIRKFTHHFPKDSRVPLDYLYHINAQYPSGEHAFAELSAADAFGWAAKPLADRLTNLDPSVRLSFLYGESTWMDKWAGLHLKDQLGDRAQFAILPNAGHHIYVDNALDFNRCIKLASDGNLRQISEMQIQKILAQYQAAQARMAQPESPAPASI